MPVSVSCIGKDDPALEDVIRLWRANSSTLGFFPDGAFRERASAGEILVATSRTEGFAGYLAYRRTRRHVSIIHLCVAPAFRGRSVARLLVDELARSAAGCDGITLRCRQDFDASRVWPRLRFEIRNEIRGRGRSGTVLVVWFRDLGAPDLFRLAARQSLTAPGIRAAIDACVFYDFHDDEPQGIESRALLADWVTESVDFFVTRELSNEVGRGEDAERRQRHRAALTAYPQCDELVSGDFERQLERVEALLPGAVSENDHSDRRHLAWAIASGVDFFLTRDERLLAAADDVQAELRTQILRPSDFLRRIDELERDAEYAPARLSGGSLVVRTVGAREEGAIAESLHVGLNGETRAQFLSRFRTFACEPRRWRLTGVFDGSRPIAVFARELGSGRLQVPLFRVATLTAATTLVRHLLFELQRAAVDEQLDVVELNEPRVSASLFAALQAEDWRCGPDGLWRRWNVRSLADGESLLSRIESVPHFSAQPGLQDEVRGADAFSVEKLLWPAKVLGRGVKNFLIPIRPAWAERLVDPRLVEQRLFSSPDNLVLNREAVYYRAPSGTQPTSRSRILWYVSDAPATFGAKSVRACSMLDDVDVGVVKDVFRRCRRYGVYDWNTVAALAGENGGRVMTLRFSNTELFARPVEFEELRSLAAEFDTGLMTAGPMVLSEPLFASIYRAGTGCA